MPHPCAGEGTLCGTLLAGRGTIPAGPSVRNPPCERGGPCVRDPRCGLAGIGAESPAFGNATTSVSRCPFTAVRSAAAPGGSAPSAPRTEQRLPRLGSCCRGSGRSALLPGMGRKTNQTPSLPQF